MESITSDGQISSAQIKRAFKCGIKPVNGDHYRGPFFLSRPSSIRPSSQQVHLFVDRRPGKWIAVSLGSILKSRRFDYQLPTISTIFHEMFTCCNENYGGGQQMVSLFFVYVSCH